MYSVLRLTLEKLKPWTAKSIVEKYSIFIPTTRKNYARKKVKTIVSIDLEISNSVCLTHLN